MQVSDFGRLLSDHTDFLKPFAFGFTRDQESARDLCQETLYRAYANKEKYNSGTNIKAWLFTIMRNTFINSYRKRSNHNTVYKDPEAFNYLNLSHAPATQLPAKEILQSIHRLPEIFRQPVLLYLEGYRYQEISSILSEPLGTIKSRIHFARKILKSEIERY